MNALRTTLTLLAFVLLTAGPAQAQLYVDADATGANDGSSWTDAYTSLQDALSAAGSSNEIWIAEGTYYPDEGSGISDNKRDTSFVVTGDQDGLEIYGGFEGTETNRSDRHPGDHPVILGGDIGTADDASENSYHVLYFDGTGLQNLTASTVLDGVTVTGGNADGSSGDTDSGGGLYCNGSSSGNACGPTLQNVVFANNDASYGGALYLDGANSGASSPAVANVVFTGNSASYGGAVYCGGTRGTASPILTNVTFTGNDASTYGGAIRNVGDQDGAARPTLTNTILWGNTAGFGGAEISNTDTVTLGHTIVEGGLSGAGIDDGALVVDDGGNLGDNPQFVDASTPAGTDGTFGTADDGLHLKGKSAATPSPAIDAGDNAALPSGMTTDLLGNPRTDEGDGDGTATVDLGAYEYSGAPLPVELAGFEGRMTGEDAVALTWQTASETGNAGFRVQRRVGEGTKGRGGAWTEVGFVDGAGTTSSAQSYRFRDDDLPYAADTLRYRLKQVDLDGTTALTDPIVVARGAVEEARLLGTYPNPARSRTTVRFAIPGAPRSGSRTGAGSASRTGAGDRHVTLRLYDVLGRRVQTVRSTAEAGRHRLRLDVSDQSSGVYFLRLVVGSTVETQKVTVVR